MTFILEFNLLCKCKNVSENNIKLISDFVVVYNFFLTLIWLYIVWGSFERNQWTLRSFQMYNVYECMNIVNGVTVTAVLLGNKMHRLLLLCQSRVYYI